MGRSLAGVPGPTRRVHLRRADETRAPAGSARRSRRGSEGLPGIKTKPTQHSVKELRSIGIAPDILVCRSNLPIPDKERKKIALFCNVDQDAVISSPDMNSIYEAPTLYHEQGLDSAVLKAFGIKSFPKTNLNKWYEVKERIDNPEGKVRVAIVGKYTGLEDAYKSINEALTHGGIANRVEVETKWIQAEVFEEEDPAPYLTGCHAILIPGGFGKRGSEGKIKAAGFARKNQVPYFGICLGMQMAVIELVRDLLGIDSAGSEEFSLEEHENSSEDLTPVIFYLKKWVHEGKKITRSEKDEKGATMRLGCYPAKLTKGSIVEKIYGSCEISERHRHRYEVDIKYKDRLESEGVLFSGMSPDGNLPEIMELKKHPWFIGVQFHPELKSQPFNPHPLFAGFIKAAIKRSRLV